MSTPAPELVSKYTQSLMRVGSVLCACGALLVIVDIVFTVTVTAPTLLTGIILGFSYMITGVLAVATGKATFGNYKLKRCLQVATRVLAILSYIDSIFFCALAVAFIILGYPLAAVELILYVAIIAASLKLAVSSALDRAVKPRVDLGVPLATVTGTRGDPLPSGQPIPYPAGPQHPGAVTPKF